MTEIDLRRGDFEGVHPKAKLFGFDEDKKLYTGDGVEGINSQWTTWCACIGMLHLETGEAKIQEVPEPTLDAPARVGGGIFQKGIKWSTVIGATQRHYEHELREPIKPIISPADMLRIATGELVLVPIDTLKECLNWSNVAKWDSPSKEVDREIAHHEGIIGAIIEAQEST